jgi:hypothetical protein
VVARLIFYHIVNSQHSVMESQPSEKLALRIC